MNELDKLIEEYYKINKDIQDLTNMKEGLRDLINQKVEEHYQENQYARPTKLISVGKEHLEGSDIEAYVASLHPEWDIVKYNEEDGNLIVHLIKKPEFIEFDYESKKYKFKKSIVNYTPKVDWEKLRATNPEIFNQISKETVTYEIDSDKFTELMDKNPELLSELENYLIKKQSSSKLLVNEVKIEE